MIKTKSREYSERKVCKVLTKLDGIKQKKFTREMTTSGKQGRINAAVTTGTAAEARAEEKVQLYGDLCAERHCDLWAVVPETTGACLFG